MKYDLSDSLAMSESGDWYAWPAEMTRGQVVNAMSSDADSWFDTLRLFHVKRGYVVKGKNDGADWYWEAEAGDADAIECWIVARRVSRR